MDLHHHDEMYHIRDKLKTPDMTKNKNGKNLFLENSMYCTIILVDLQFALREKIMRIYSLKISCTVQLFWLTYSLHVV